MPSSDGIYDELDDISLYPRLPQWLQELDDGVRGRDGRNYAQYGAALEEAGYDRICDLEDEGLVTPESLGRDWGMKSGVATKVLSWARHDVKKIKDSERRRLREIRFAPKHHV